MESTELIERRYGLQRGMRTGSLLLLLTLALIGVSDSAVTDTAANKSSLQYNWTGTEGNPTSRARFGTVKSGPTIHQRELF